MKKILAVFIIIFCVTVGYSQVFATDEETTAAVTASLTPCTPSTENCVTLLEELPLGGSQGMLSGILINTEGDESGLGGFINFIFQIGIGIAGVLGVVMLTIYGFQYAANDKNISTFSVLRERITSVVMGLLLLLGIFILLNTINPDLLLVEPELNTQYLNLNAQDQGSIEYENGQKLTVDYGNKVYERNNACMGQTSTLPNATCKKIPSSWKDSTKGNYVEASFHDKLQVFANRAESKNIIPRITEAWPPSRQHKASCHSLGTCIDATHANPNGTRKVPNSTEVKDFIALADQVGICAQYEVKTTDTKNRLIAAGVPAKHILVLGSWISASHYSIYNGICN